MNQEGDDNNNNDADLELYYVSMYSIPGSLFAHTEIDEYSGLLIMKCSCNL